MKLHSRSLSTIRSRPAVYFRLLSALALVYAPLALAAPQSGPKPSAAPHVDLRPKLVPGEVLVYQIQLQTITDTKPTGAISDPQGPSRLAVTWDATVKLEVLGELAQTPAAPPPPAPKPATGKADSGQAARRSSPVAAPQAAPQSAPLSAPLRIRTTYEHSAASVKSDSPDPQSDEIEARYAQLDGRAIEFTVERTDTFRKCMDSTTCLRTTRSARPPSNGCCRCLRRPWLPEAWPSGKAGTRLSPRFPCLSRKWCGEVIPPTCATSLAVPPIPAPPLEGVVRRYPHAPSRPSSKAIARSHARRLSPQRIAHGGHVDGLGRKPQLCLSGNACGRKRHARQFAADRFHGDERRGGFHSVCGKYRDAFPRGASAAGG